MVISLLKKAIMTLLMISLISLTGCQKEMKETPVSENAIVFTDDLGREITVCEPMRVAALTGSLADVWYLAGGTVRASVEDAWDDFDIEMPKDAVNFGMTKEPSLEKLFAAEPDFVLASVKTRANMDMLDTLEAAGITSAYFEINDFEDYMRVLKICTDITGREDLYTKNGLEVQAQIESVIETSEERLQSGDAPKVLVLRASAASIRAKNSQGNVLGEILYDLGCVNIADQEDSLLENLNVEYILKEDPDYIFAVQVGDDRAGVEAAVKELFADDSAWSKLTAVKEDKIYIMDNRLYNFMPNALWGEAYEGAERILTDE